MEVDKDEHQDNPDDDEVATTIKNQQGDHDVKEGGEGKVQARAM